MSHEDLVKRLRKTSVLDHPMEARHAMDIASLALQHADTRAAEDRALILMLQKALAYWMPSVFDERSAHDAYLLAGYDGKDEVGYWDQCAAAQPDERIADLVRAYGRACHRSMSATEMNNAFDAVVTAIQARATHPTK